MTVFPAAVTSTISPATGEDANRSEITFSTPCWRRRRRKGKPSGLSSPKTIREIRSSPQATCGLSEDARASTVPSRRSRRAPAKVLVPRSSATPRGLPRSGTTWSGTKGPSSAISLPSMYAESRAGRLSGRTVTVTFPETGTQRQARRTPERRSSGESVPGSSPLRVSPATVTLHLPHLPSPPQGERIGTPARTACARIVSPAERGALTSSGRNRRRGVSAMGREERGRREPTEIGGERGGLLRAHQDAPPRELLDLAREARHHPRQDEGPVLHLSLDAAAVA